MILYESTETEFKTQGLCNLNNIIDGNVIEEINGIYELEFEYPIDDKHFKDIKFRRIVYCKPSPNEKPQPFRIYSISKSINRRVIVNACHISYDTSGYPVEPFAANSIVEAVNTLKTNTISSFPFDFTTDLTSSGEIKMNVPKSVRSILGDEILNNYNPEYYFDHFIINCQSVRGVDRGVEIRYGKNMLDMKQEENISNVYTDVYPFWRSDTGGLITLPEKTISTPGSYNYTKTYIYDMSSVFQDKPTIEQIREATLEYININKLGIPKVSLTLSFLQLSTSTEYSSYSLLDKVDLGDTVTVVFEEAGVKTSARCVKTKYNIKKNRYDSIEIGDVVKTLSDEIVESNKTLTNKIDQTINDTTNKTYFEKMLDNLMNDITGNSGGYIRLNPPKNPSELFIMDTNNIDTAVVIWRWDRTGLSVSRNGKSGTFFPVTNNGKLIINENTTEKIKSTMIDSTS